MKDWLRHVAHVVQSWPAKIDAQRSEYYGFALSDEQREFDLVDPALRASDKRDRDGALGAPDGDRDR
jgi:hypothetical protein